MSDEQSASDLGYWKALYDFALRVGADDLVNRSDNRTAMGPMSEDVDF